MPLWFEIVVLVLLVAIVFELIAIEGNILSVASAIRDQHKQPFQQRLLWAEHPDR